MSEAPPDTDAPAEAVAPRPGALLALASHRGARFGLAVALLVAGAALLSFVWTPYRVDGVDVANRMQAPSRMHLLGTDHLGRDILSMLMVGARTSLAVALVAVGLGMGLGVPLGLLAAARRGGWLDEVVMRGNDLVFAFPSLVIAILITAILGPSALNAILAIGIFNVPVFARLTRGAALPIWQRDFVLAAQVAGKGRARISAEHVLPNLASLLIVQGTIQFSLGILAEAALSYIGLGAQPPTPSWGRMLAEAQTLIALAPHLAIFPGLAILLTVLALNLAGDGLRDALDPRLARPR